MKSLRLQATLSCALAACLPWAKVFAQSRAELDTRWHVAGEVGGVIGGTWLSGLDVPTVATGGGAQVAIRATRTVSAGARAGAALRVGAQPLHLTENAVRWDGGTLADVQLVGTLSLGVTPVGALMSDIDFSAGVSTFSGASTIVPFRSAPRVAPSADVGISVHRGRSSDEANAEREPHPYALFARYSAVRIDPGSPTTGEVGRTSASAGWARRVTVGMRVQR